MNEKSQKLIGGAVKIGKKILSVSEVVLLELIEQYEDMVYMRTHCYAVLGQNVRSARYESEEGARLHELKMKRQAIKRLAEQKLIKLRKEGERVVFELTTNGKIRALKILIMNCDDYFFDDRICLVSFDVPEVSDTARVAFRRFLKSSGFSFVQGSVWSIKKDVLKEMRDLIMLLKITRWVEIYLARQ